MQIGLSLPTGYLAGLIGDDVEMWVEMFGPRESGLKALKGLGVTSIELNDVREHTPLIEIRQAIEFVSRMGLQLSVHLWLPLLDDGRLPAGFMEATSVIDGIETGVAVQAVIHGHRSSMFPRVEEAWDRTVQDLRTLCHLLEQGESSMVPTLELCREKDGGPVGVTFDEILELVEEIDSPSLGICWDLGHGLSNVLVHGHEEFPPEDFLAGVTHTHIHGVLPNGRTHGPIGRDGGMVGNNTRTYRLLEVLRDFGYQGIYNLELYPARWERTNALRRDLVCRSIETLQEIGG